MILKSDSIAALLEDRDNRDPLIICPGPNIKDLRTSGAASVDLRLGTWFASMRNAQTSFIRVSSDSTQDSSQDGLTKMHYVPFGDSYYLHPRTFALGVTLEWIRLPSNTAAYVIGKSSWGRRGLTIATATGVHPGFTGCLTLEISNVGEVPIEIKPGMRICQLFIHLAEGSSAVGQTTLLGRRKPFLGKVTRDPIAEKLADRQRPK